MSLDSFADFYLSSSSANCRMPTDRSWVSSTLPTISLQIFSCPPHVNDSQIHICLLQHFTHIFQLDIWAWRSTKHLKQRILNWTSWSPPIPKHLSLVLCHKWSYICYSPQVNVLGVIFNSSLQLHSTNLSPSLFGTMISCLD